MTRVSPTRLGLAAASIIIAVTGLLVMQGVIRADRYEGDMLHLMDIVLRIADGQVPHIDFMTPLGVLGVWPIAAFVEAGAGFGHAVFLAQAAVALALAPLAVWVATSRFDGLTAYAYIALVIIFPLALVSGGDEANISLSMHYNRWAWAAAFVAVPVALLPPLRRSAWLDGLAMGLPLAALVLVKATYAVALVPGIVVLLIARRAFAALGIGVLAGLAALALVTLWFGPSFWVAYVGDLVAVAGSEHRARPGLPFNNLLTAPAYVMGHLATLAAIILLRRSEHAVMGLGLLALVPGFVFITYQNFGNDPQWMFLTGLVLLQALPREGGPRQGLMVAAVALLAFSAPSIVNLAFSPLRNGAKDPEKFALVLPDSARHGDFHTRESGFVRVDMNVAGEDRIPSLAASPFAEERDDAPVEVAGTVLERCQITTGLLALQALMAEDLVAQGHGGARIFVADLLSSHWLFSDALPPLPGGAPWLYGGLPGIESADLVLVPRCPLREDMRADTVAALDAAGWTLAPVAERDLYVLVRPTREAGPDAGAEDTLASVDQPTAASAR